MRYDIAPWYFIQLVKHLKFTLTRLFLKLPSDVSGSFVTKLQQLRVL